jgi:release factor glutamine methyltransferase
MKIYEALTQARCFLEQSACPNPRLDAERLLCTSLGSNHSYLAAHSRDDLGASELESFFMLVQKRCAGMPVQYIVGIQEFRGLEFEVTPDVLIPRPETEILVEEVLTSLQAGTPTLADVGTGSGCVAVTLALERPDARVFAIDLSDAALEVARRNARKHGVEGRIRFLQGDLLAPLSLLLPNEVADCICSNPPYVAERDLSTLQREVRDWEPRLALSAGAEGLQVIRRLVPQALRILRPRGFLIFEIGYNQQERISSLFSEGWQSIRLREDLSGIPRIVVAQKH